MLRLRSTLSRLAYAFGLFVLSTLVVISTPTTAQALLPSPGPVTISPSKGFKFGKVVPGPIGWAITAGFAGWWAFDNKDGIVKWFGAADKSIADWFGEATDDTGGGAAIGNQPRCSTDYHSACITIATDGISDVGSGTTPQTQQRQTRFVFRFECMDVKYTGPTGIAVCGGTGNVSLASQRKTYCRNWSTGVTRHEITSQPFGVTPSTGSPGTTTVSCATGEIVVRVDWLINRGAPNDQSFGWIRPGFGPQGDILPGVKEFNVTVWCRNAETDAVQTISHVTPGTDKDNLLIPSCKARLGDDWYGFKIKVAPVLDPDTLPEDLPLWDVPDFPPWEWDEEIPDEVQPCDKSKQGCSLSVWIDSDPCDEGRPVCRQWTKVLEQNPSRVHCRYGVKEVGMVHCRALGADAYKPDGKTEVDKQVPTKPKPEDPPGTQPRPEPPATPKPTPTPTVPIPNPDNPNQNCMGGMVSLNPVDWVFTPVKCAFQWAFVPKTDMKVRLERMKARLDNKVPFSWVSGVTTLPTSISGQGCPNWRISVGSVNRNIICDTAFGDAMRGARPVWVVLLGGAAMWPLLRSVLYASFPVVKPVPK